MMSKFFVGVRIGLSVVLVYAVYTETGIFTAIAIGLSVLNGEVTAALVKGLRRRFP